MRGRVVGLLAAAAFARPAFAADALDRVESPVYEAPGTPQDLARRAVVCMGQVLKPGFTTAPTIVAQDIETGRIVGNNAFNFADYFIFRTVYPGRATTTFEAKDGRFRIVNTDIEQFVLSTWGPVLAPKKPHADDIRATLLAVSDKVATCVKAPSTDW